MPPSNERRNQYNSTPRKVFDKAMDRQDRRLKRVQEDYRNDVQAIFQRTRNLEAQLVRVLLELEDHAGHLESHCLDIDNLLDRKNNPEELE